MRARKLISAILAGVMAVCSLSAAVAAEGKAETAETAATEETTASPKASSNVFQRCYFADGNYVYIETVVQVFVETSYPIYTGFLNYGYGDTGIYPQYRPISCDYTISDDQKSITCFFRFNKYTADDVTDSKVYHKTITFHADDDYDDAEY